MRISGSNEVRSPEPLQGATPQQQPPRMHPVQDRLEAPQDAGILSGLFSYISDCLIALYEWVSYLIQAPINWIFRSSTPKDVEDLDPKPKGENEDQSKWNKDALLTAIERAENHPDRMKVLTEVAYKRSEDREIDRDEVFEVINKFKNKEPVTYAEVMVFYGSDAAQDEDFDFNKFFKAVVQYATQSVVQRLREAETIYDQLDRLDDAIPTGIDLMEGLEKKVAIETVRQLMRAMNPSDATQLGECMRARDPDADLPSPFIMTLYLAKKNPNIGLIRDSIGNLFFNKLCEEFASDEDIYAKLDRLAFAIGKFELEENRTDILAAFDRVGPNKPAYAIFKEKLGEPVADHLSDTDALLRAIRETKDQLAETARRTREEAEERRRAEEERDRVPSAEEVRAQKLAQLRKEGEPLRDQIDLLREILITNPDDREAVIEFVKVEAQRNALAEGIAQKARVQDEHPRLSELAKDMPSHYSKQSSYLWWDSTMTALWSVLDPRVESERTRMDREAVEEYFQQEHIYSEEGFDMGDVQIGLRKTHWGFY